MSRLNLALWFCICFIGASTVPLGPTMSEKNQQTETPRLKIKIFHEDDALSFDHDELLDSLGPLTNHQGHTDSSRMADHFPRRVANRHARFSRTSRASLPNINAHRSKVFCFFVLTRIALQTMLLLKLFAANSSLALIACRGSASVIVATMRASGSQCDRSGFDTLLKPYQIL